MSELDTNQAAGIRSGGGWSWFLNPYLQLALNGVLVATGQLLMKVAADATADIPAPRWLEVFGLTALGSWWIWAGIAFHIGGFANWLYILRVMPVSIAFSLASIAQVLVPLAAWLFLHEAISPLRWGGIAMIIGGIWLIAERFTRAEEAL